MNRNAGCFATALTLLLFSLNVQAGWKCSQGYQDIEPQACSRAGISSTPQAFINAYVNAISAINIDSNVVGYKAGTCSIWGSADGATCGYTWTSYGTSLSGAVDVVKEADTVSCPPALESRGPDSSVTKSGDKYYVNWSVRQVANDLCHNSCSYLADSALVGKCYLVTGSKTTGFCNYFVGLNSDSPACSFESGYTAPGTGDSLTATDSGGGSDDGSGSGGTGGDGSGNTGGTGGEGSDGGYNGSGFDGELKFSSPGSLDAKSVLDNEQNALGAELYVNGLQSTFNESEFGKAITDLKQTVLLNVSSGVCPTPVINLGFTTVVLDSHCQILSSSNVIGILTALFMAFWTLVAVRIVLSA